MYSRFFKSSDELDYFSSLLLNKFFYLTTLLILMHQVSIGLSILIITKAIERVGIGGSIIDLLIFYVLFMLMPYVFASAADYFRIKWRNFSYTNFVNLSIENTGKEQVFIDASQYSDLNNKIIKISHDVISDCVYFSTSTLSAFLNSFISIIAFSMVLDLRFSLVIGGSFVFALLYIHRSQRRLSEYSENDQSSLMEYFGVLEKGVLNYIYGSGFNTSIWKNQKNKPESNYIKLSEKHIYCQQRSHLISSLILLIPISIFIIYFYYDNAHNSAAIALLLALSTRIYHIVSSLSELAFNLLSWGSIHGSLSLILNQKIEKPVFNKTQLRIEISPTEYEALILNDDMPKNGRVTIRGANGSGKTSLVHQLRIKNKINSVYYNPKYELSWSESNDHLSQGEKTMLDINEMFKHKLDIRHYSKIPH